MNTMKWLLKREYWEHRGGFFWAPIIGGGIFLLLNLMGIIAGQLAAGRANIKVGMFKLDSMLNGMDAQAQAMFGSGVDLTMYSTTMFVGVITGFVLFFYCLGALYDDRRDRSVLFWKSLPVSDRDTVISKVITALVVVPLISLAAGIITALLQLAMIGIFFAFHGINAFGAMLSFGHPFRTILTMFGALPVTMLVALPTVGWLMLCSAWAKGKPFLWAVGIPIGAGIIVNIMDLMQRLAIPDVSFWRDVVFRSLFGIFPGAWMDDGFFSQFKDMDDGGQMVVNIVSLDKIYAVLASPTPWIAAAIGVAMLVVATRLRRWRDEG